MGYLWDGITANFSNTFDWQMAFRQGKERRRGARHTKNRASVTRTWDRLSTSAGDAVGEGAARWTMPSLNLPCNTRACSTSEHKFLWKQSGKRCSRWTWRHRIDTNTIWLVPMPQRSRLWRTIHSNQTEKAEAKRSTRLANYPKPQAILSGHWREASRHRTFPRGLFSPQWTLEWSFWDLTEKPNATCSKWPGRKMPASGGRGEWILVRSRPGHETLHSKKKRAGKERRYTNFFQNLIKTIIQTI